MDCGELRDAILRGDAPGPEAEAHGASCPPCAELIADAGALAHALPTAAPAPAAGGFAAVADRVHADRGARAWLASRPSTWRAALLVGGVALVAFGAGLGAARPDLDVYPTARMALALGLLVAAILPLAWLALRPLHQAPLGGGRVAGLAVLGAVGVPLLLAALPAAHTAHPMATVPAGLFVSKALGCFVFGGLIALPLIVWAALLDRGGAPLRNPTLWALGVAVAALGANVALQLHCPVTEQAHLAASHAPVGLALVALTALVAVTWRRLKPAVA